MKVVVDASVAAKWLVDEEGSDAADTLLDGSFELFAPRLMASEVGSALRHKVRMGKLEVSAAGELASQINDLTVIWSEDQEVAADATRLALALDCSVFDCIYLALAHRVGAKLITEDKRFVNAVAHTEHGGIVTTLAEFVIA